ncbi:hypothetical protein ACFOZ5_03570 [Marinobacter lacisalsi]|uniref:DUF2798 domain-containing protein n=1 Tax=Marinobacter lacisalsi TaxID=475979 RepID=A0ABV8QED1_9GAMM
MNSEGKDEKIIKKKQGILVVSVSIVFVLGALITLISGKTFFADSEIMHLIWLAVFLGVLPVLLLLSFRAAVKARKSRESQ